MFKNKIQGRKQNWGGSNAITKPFLMRSFLSLSILSTTLLLSQGYNAFHRTSRSSTTTSSPFTFSSSSSSLRVTPSTTLLFGTSESKDGKVKKASTKEDIVVDWDWEQMARDVFSDDDKRPIVLFDGVCNLCNSGVNFAMDQDEKAKLRFASLQSRVGQSLLLRSGKSATDTSNIVLVTEDKAYFSSNAVSRICMELDSLPLQWFGQLGQHTSPWIRESLYKLVSKNRYQFGENDQCRMDYDGTYTSRFVSDPPVPSKDDESSE